MRGRASLQDLILKLPLLFLFVLLQWSFGHAQTIKSQKATFKLKVVTSGLNHPWSMAFLPNGDILVTERPGRIRLIKNGRLQKKSIQGLPKIEAGGQGGLLDLILDPDFKKNRLIYFSYSARGKAGLGTHVSRARFDGTRLTDHKLLFKAKPKIPNYLHFGSRLLFDKDGYLFITIGEKYNMHEAQNLNSHLGAIIRLNADGTVPKNNPFTGKKDNLPEIYSYGHRNPQGIALHPVTKKVWAHEHGPRGGDEVNILKPGANYGWPKVTYGIDYSGDILSNKTHLPGIEPPLLHWTPSIAPSGMAFYTGDKFPQWQGDLFVGALARRHLRRISLEGRKVISQEILLRGLDERIRDVRNGPGGYLYILTDSSEGKLIRLEPVQ